MPLKAEPCQVHILAGASASALRKGHSHRKYDVDGDNVVQTKQKTMPPPSTKIAHGSNFAYGRLSQYLTPILAPDWHHAPFNQIKAKRHDLLSRTQRLGAHTARCRGNDAHTVLNRYRAPNAQYGFESITRARTKH